MNNSRNHRASSTESLETKCSDVTYYFNCFYILGNTTAFSLIHQLYNLLFGKYYFKQLSNLLDGKIYTEYRKHTAIYLALKTIYVVTVIDYYWKLADMP